MTARGFDRVPAPLPSRSRGWTRAVVCLVVCGAALFGLLTLGGALPAPHRPQHVRPAAAAVSHGLFVQVLAALAALVAISRGMGALFARFQQPAVIGEIVAGILLGPSLMGRLTPGLSSALFPPVTITFLTLWAGVGIVLYMFVIGLDIDLKKPTERSRSVVAISYTSIAAPLILGCGLAIFLYPRLSSDTVSFTKFALFLGISLSITAFPVLARILQSRGIQHADLGKLALTCAAVNDVVGWCLLALVVGLAESQGKDVAPLAAMALYLLGMLLLGAPLLRFVAKASTARSLKLATTLAAVVALVSATTSEHVGLHALFGGFFAGVFIPSGSLLARRLKSMLDEVLPVLFLPSFFALTGLRTQISLVESVDQWLICALVIATACVGKVGGTAGAARSSGLPWREALSLGALMNTRGLMELIVLNVGLDLGIISPTLFTILVVMAIFTTWLTTPLLDLIGGFAARVPRLRSRPPEPTRVAFLLDEKDYEQ